jgi:hypothetical protein
MISFSLISVQIFCCEFEAVKERSEIRVINNKFFMDDNIVMNKSIFLLNSHHSMPEKFSER